MNGGSRRTLLQAGAGLIGGAMLPGGMIAAGVRRRPSADRHLAGRFVRRLGVHRHSVPRTGTYAVQGEDELKGYQLAIEHINEGNELVKKISPKTKKGVLGKEVEVRRRRIRPPSRTKPCRRSSASSPRTRR